MSSRQEEKARLKEERLRLEREAAAREKRRRVVQIGAAGLTLLAVIVGVVLATAGGSATNQTVASPDAVPLPAKQTDDLAVAVKAAGCTLKQFASEGQGHVEETTALKFKTNPPTSGDHFQIPAPDGLYDPGNPPERGNWVHSLEHGRVLLQYRKGTPSRRIGQLQTLFNEPYAGEVAGYHTLLQENNSRMPFAVAAVAWTRYVGCKTLNNRTFDALRAFRTQFVDKAPEQVP